MQLIGTVSESINLAGRGIALFFTSSPHHLAQTPSLQVLVTRPDGTTSTFAASREFARQVAAPNGEVISLFIAGASPSQIPVGSVLVGTTASGA